MPKRCDDLFILPGKLDLQSQNNNNELDGQDWNIKPAKPSLTGCRD